MSPRKIAAVARREYVETVRTKAFILGLLLMPGMIIGMTFLSAKTSVRTIQSTQPARIAVADHTGRLATELSKLAIAAGFNGRRVEFEVVTASTADELDALKNRVREGALSGLLEIPPKMIAGNEPCAFYTNKSRSDSQSATLQNLLNAAVKRLRFIDAGIDGKQLDELSRPVAVNEQNLVADKARQDNKSVVNMMTPFAFEFLMFMGVFALGQGLLTSVIEEKSSRVVEVLLSALSPLELMSGKILGMVGVGLTMVCLWCGVGYGAARWQHLDQLVQIADLGHFILYYILGFLLISSLLAAIGSACNTLKDAQPFMAPLSLVMVIPMMFWFHIVHAPNSAIAVALSFVPPMTPFVMILRLASQEAAVPLWQQIAIPIWLAIWVLVAIWAASRTFRVGLLMYGKAPSLRELIKWVAHR